MTKHAYLPTMIIFDKGSAFVSQVIKEAAYVLGKTLEHPTTKHAQTISMLKSTHAPLQEALEKIQLNEDQCDTSVSTMLY